MLIFYQPNCHRPNISSIASGDTAVVMNAHFCSSLFFMIQCSRLHTSPRKKINEPPKWVHCSRKQECVVSHHNYHYLVLHSVISRSNIMHHHHHRLRKYYYLLHTPVVDDGAGHSFHFFKSLGHYVEEKCVYGIYSHEYIVHSAQLYTLLHQIKWYDRLVDAPSITSSSLRNVQKCKRP